MKKFSLLLLLACAFSVGAWADGTGYTLSYDSWHSNDPTLFEPAIKVELTQEGALQGALDEINNGGVTCTFWVADAPGSDNFVQWTIDVKDSKIICISGPLGDADLTALSNLSFETVVLEDASWNLTSKSFTNANVRYLILPSGWTKEEVNSITLEHV